MSITYVTAYLDLKDGCKKTRSHETCFQHFEHLAKAKIPIVVFLSRNFAEEASRLEAQYPRVQCEFIDIEELETYKETYSVPDLQIPKTPAPEKDTKHFMILMNAKIEFVQKALQKNPFQTNHFAWIDFSIHYVFRNRETIAKLQEHAANKWSTCLVFPGCWNKDVGYAYVHQSIHWRFCGGFFLGDKESLLKFANLYRNAFTKILNEHKTMLWEVNIWSILEKEYDWSPSWFQAGHDDSIINVPNEYVSIE